MPETTVTPIIAKSCQPYVICLLRTWSTALSPAWRRHLNSLMAVMDYGLNTSTYHTDLANAAYTQCWTCLKYIIRQKPGGIHVFRANLSCLLQAQQHLAQTQCTASHPGSTHKALVFNQSTSKQQGVRSLKCAQNLYTTESSDTIRDKRVNIVTRVGLL